MGADASKPSASASASRSALAGASMSSAQLPAGSFGKDAFFYQDIAAIGSYGSVCSLDVCTSLGLVAVGTTRGAVRIYGPFGVQKWLRSIDEHSVIAVHFLPLRRALLAVSADSTIRVWDLSAFASPAKQAPITARTSTAAASASAGNASAAVDPFVAHPTAWLGSNAQTFSVLAAACTFSLTLSSEDDEENPNRVVTCTLLPQHAAHASRFLYIGTACGSVLVFDTIALRLSNVQFAAPAATVMSPSTSASASSSSGLFRIPAFAGDSTETVFDAVTALCAHASDPALIYVGYSSGVVCLWSAQTRKVRQRWMAPTQTAAPVAVTALAAHPAGMDEKDCKSAALIAGHADGTLIAWAHTSSGTSSSPAWQTAVAAPPSADSALAAESIAADDKPSGIVQLAWSSAGVWVAGGHVANQQLAGLRLLPSDRVASAAKPTCADFELAGCASNGVWLAAASSALLAGAVAAQQPSPLGGIGSQTVVDFLSDAAAVRAFALPTNVAGNATASATASASANVNGPIVWATSAGEVWVARRPGEIAAPLAHDHLLASTSCTYLASEPSGSLIISQQDSPIQRWLRELRHHSRLHEARSKLVSANMWPVGMASYHIPNSGKVPYVGAFEPQQSTPSVFITGHVGKLCVWDASCPWSLDLLHCIDLLKNDVKVTCIHVDMTARAAFISAGCDTGDVWVFRSRDGPSADADADSTTVSDSIGPFVLHYSMPIHVSSVHCLVYSAALARLAIGDTDAVFTLSDIVSGQTLCYEMLNSVAVADAASSQAPETTGASTDAVVTSLAFAPWSIADGESTSLMGTSINAVLVGLSSGRLLAFSVTEGKPLFDYALPAVDGASAASVSVASVDAAWPQAIRFCAAMDVESRALVCESQTQSVVVAPVEPSIALPASAAAEPVDADPGAPEAPLQQPGDTTSIVAHATLPAKVADKARVLIVASGQHVALYEMVPLSRTSAHPVKFCKTIKCAAHIESATIISSFEHRASATAEADPSPPSVAVAVVCADAHVRVFSLFDLTELLDETLEMDAAKLPLCQMGTDGRGILPTTDGLLMRLSILPPEQHIPPSLVLPAGLPNSPQNQFKGADVSSDSTKLAALEVQPRRSMFQSLFGSAEHDLLDLLTTPMPADAVGGTGRVWSSPHLHPTLAALRQRQQQAQQKLQRQAPEPSRSAAPSGDASSASEASSSAAASSEATAALLARARAQTQRMRDRRAEAEVRQTAAAADADADTYSANDVALRERLNRRALGLDRDGVGGADSASSSSASGGVSAAAGAQSAMARNVDAARRNVSLAAEIGVKSQQMADDAKQFASLAKKLKERNSSWW